MKLTFGAALVAVVAVMVPSALAQNCGGDKERPCVTSIHGRSGCDEGLNRIKGICTTEEPESCGGIGEVLCPMEAYYDDNGCDDDLIPIDDLCQACGQNGEPACPEGPTCGFASAKPCPDTGCDNGLVEVGGICDRLDDPPICGFLDAVPCPDGCDDGLEEVNGVCGKLEDPPICGFLDAVPCPDGCDDGLEEVDGVCGELEDPPICGFLDAVPCPDGCDDGLEEVDGVCGKLKDPPLVGIGFGRR